MVAGNKCISAASGYSKTCARKVLLAEVYVDFCETLNIRKTGELEKTQRRDAK